MIFFVKAAKSCIFALGPHVCTTLGVNHLTFEGGVVWVIWFGKEYFSQTFSDRIFFLTYNGVRFFLPLYTPWNTYSFLQCRDFFAKLFLARFFSLQVSLKDNFFFWNHPYLAPPQKSHGRPLIFLFSLLDGGDYHWYRMDNRLNAHGVALWSHKLGQAPVIDYDMAVPPQPITDPSTANHGPYVFVGYMYSNPHVNIAGDLPCSYYLQLLPH